MATATVKLELEHLGSGYGQHNYVIRAIQDREQVGKLEFNVFDEVPAISWIEVDEQSRGSGVATRMVHLLQSTYPAAMIDTGGLTEDGAAFFARLPVRSEQNEAFAMAENRLVELRKRLQWFETRAAEISASEDKSGLEDLQYWNEALDDCDELEQVLKTEPQEFRYFVVDESCDHGESLSP